MTMNTTKEQNMINHISTNLVWDQLATSGKAIVNMALINISQLHDEARDYGVRLSIKRSDTPYHDSRLYVYFRKNRG